jgi:hypothetical protein
MHVQTHKVKIQLNLSTNYNKFVQKSEFGTFLCFSRYLDGLPAQKVILCVVRDTVKLNTFKFSYLFLTIAYFVGYSVISVKFLNL